MRFEHSRRNFIKQSSMLAAAVSAGSGLIVPAWAQSGAAVEADTTFGRVRGGENRGIKFFKGIPYGASTAGANRFQPPRDPAKWTGVRDTLAYGAVSPQREPSPKREADEQGAGQGNPESEDCLLLNVWTPAIADGGKRPVIVWCHGGGFNTGSGAAPVNDGTSLGLRGDIVTVTVNHRLNVLGYTYLGELDKGFEQSGDVGILDIAHSLKWVHDNIAQFGGDPGNVTIIGQSGGAWKVSTLLTMPSAKGLFHRAVVMSGSALQLIDKEQGARVTRELVAKLGLSKPKVADLQALPIDTLMTAYFATIAKLSAENLGRGFVPTVDGKAVTQHPFHPTASMVSPDVPVIFSSTSGEVTFRADEKLFHLDEAGMHAQIQQRIGAKTDSVIALYRKLYPGSTPSDLYFAIGSDFQYGAAAMKAAERRAALGRAPAWLYYWTWESPAEGGKFKAQHTIDIPFVFDNVKASRLTSGAPDAQALADQVSEAFIAFFRTGNPNTPKSKLPNWPAFEPNNRPTMVFSAKPELKNDPIREQRLAMWDAMGLTT